MVAVASIPSAPPMLSIVVTPETSEHATVVSAPVSCALTLPSITYLPAARLSVWTVMAAVEAGKTCAAVVTAENAAGTRHSGSVDTHGSPLAPVAPVSPLAPAGPVAPGAPSLPAAPAGPCGPCAPSLPG